METAIYHWAITNFGGYSKANAKLFSNMKCEELGVSGYGDPDYVDHVMRYVGLGFGNIRGEPNFENMKAWGRFYELYVYSPGFTGNGNQCMDQLVAAHPDKFEKSTLQRQVLSSLVLDIIMSVL